MYLKSHFISNFTVLIPIGHNNIVIFRSRHVCNSSWNTDYGATLVAEILTIVCRTIMSDI